jgi:hypothetical protein
MNQYSQEIQEELTKIAEKYNIQRGMLLFEEKSIKDGSTNYRSIIFQPNIKKLSVCKFATLFLSCVNISKTMQKIMDHVNLHSINDLIDHAIFLDGIEKAKEKGQIN